MNNFYNNFKIIAYADGACHNNGFKNSRGGWAFVIRFDDNKKEIHSAGYAEMTTNQRMELTAAIKLLEEIKTRWPNLNIPAIILSDSQYVVKGSTEWMFNWERKGWKRNNSRNGQEGRSAQVINLDLWKKMFELVNEIHPTIRWIKGHAGYEYNELCDALATSAVETQSDYYKIVRVPTRN
jgi:ribonuclease HI